MAKSLSALKKKRKTSLKALQDKVQEQKGGSTETDERIWKPVANKDGYVFATIRFLPAPPDTDYGVENLPYASWIDFSFENNGKTYWNKSRKSISKEEPDPVSEFNNHLYKVIGTEESKAQASRQKRRFHHIANILVIKDATNPENEGKVFLYEFGNLIFNKIDDQLCPPKGSGRDVLPVFDPWDGADFLIEGKPDTFKIGGRTIEYANLENSRFESAKPLFDGDDDKIDEVWNKQHSINEFTDSNPKFFKSYDELVKDLEKVMGGRTMVELLDADYKPSKKKDVIKELEETANDESLDGFLEDDDDTDDIPSFVKEAKKEKKTTKKAKVEAVAESENDDLDDLQDLADLDDLDDLEDL